MILINLFLSRYAPKFPFHLAEHSFLKFNIVHLEFLFLKEKFSILTESL